MDEKVAQRFFAKTKRDDKPARYGLPVPCLLWTAKLDRRGYGSLWVNGRPERASRVAFFLEHGRWPEPCALHQCHNPPCVESSHIHEGTNAQNSAEMVASSRQERGEDRYNASLTESAVREIRASKETQVKLAVRFGVSQPMISSIVLRKRWKHVA